MREKEKPQDALAELAGLVRHHYQDIDDVVAYCRAIREGYTHEEARQIASDEEGSGPGSPVAESYEQANGALKSVLAERERQNKKWGVQNHDLPTWHAIVSEELGEAAEAVLKRKHDADEGEKHIGHVRDEFVQVAATALQVVEYIDRVHFSADE
jgi:NTP pyrophosphatase (non-canonical NTP hydrolase)